jgi:hypothetical protein
MSQSPPERGLALKVHRVATADEVAVLAGLGVNYIGFDVDDDAYYGIDRAPLFGDERYVLRDGLGDLLARVGEATPVVELGADQWSPDVPAELVEQGVELVQVPVRQSLESDVVEAADRAGLTVVWSDIVVEPDDPVDYAAASLDPQRPNLAFYDIQLFPSYGENAWAFLRDESPRHPGDALSFDDIDAIAAKSPLFVALDVAPENCGEILQTFGPSAVRGLSFTLSPTELGTYHTVEFDRLVEILEAIRGVGAS